GAVADLQHTAPWIGRGRCRRLRPVIEEDMDSQAFAHEAQAARKEAPDPLRHRTQQTRRPAAMIGTARLHGPAFGTTRGCLDQRGLKEGFRFR
ncbi:MAG TPA: hypothetical protein VJO99_25780, partial [Burkholderiaceae bacterium]|nr:hypothetical protein [Burkholderiaceae bacterium]